MNQYLPLPFQSNLVLIYRSRRDGRLSWLQHFNWLNTHTHARALAQHTPADQAQTIKVKQCCSVSRLAYHLTQTEIISCVSNNCLELCAKTVPSGTHLSDILAAFKRPLKTSVLLTMTARCHTAY